MLLDVPPIQPDYLKQVGDTGHCALPEVCPPFNPDSADSRGFQRREVRDCWKVWDRR